MFPRLLPGDCGCSRSFIDRFPLESLERLEGLKKKMPATFFLFFNPSWFVAPEQCVSYDLIGHITDSPPPTKILGHGFDLSPLCSSFPWFCSVTRCCLWGNEMERDLEWETERVTQSYVSSRKPLGVRRSSVTGSSLTEGLRNKRGQSFLPHAFFSSSCLLYLPLAACWLKMCYRRE